jgi:hypothetical protein
MSHRPERKRKTTHRHREQQQNEFDDTETKKKSDICRKRTKNISDKSNFDDSDATNINSDTCLEDTKKDIDISGTHVVVEYDSTDLPPVKYVDINSLPESPNKKLSSTDVTTQQVKLFFESNCFYYIYKLFVIFSVHMQ